MLSARRKRKVKELVTMYLKFARGYKKPIHPSYCVVYNEKQGILPEMSIVYDPFGAGLLETFAAYDDRGELIPTRHAESFRAAIFGKARLNLLIKIWAERDGPGVLELMKEFPDLPDWVWEAVYAQGAKYFQNYTFRFEGKLWKVRPFEIDPKEMTRKCRELVKQEVNEQRTG